MRGECYVCKRWGSSLQMIAPNKGRHEDCSPGSTLWAEWYATLPKSQRTDAGDFLYQHATRAKGKPHV